MKKLFTLVFLLAVLFPYASAGADTSLQISPAKNSFTAQPGSTVRATISLKNPTNTLTTVTVVPRDFDASPNLDGQPKVIENGSSPYGISNWLTDANLDKKLTVPANQVIEYEAVFRVPNTASEKTYFGLVTFEVEDHEDAAEALGSIVFITVGNPKTSLGINKLEFGESDDASKRHGVFTAFVDNTSDALSTPRLKLKISDNEGNIVVELDQDSEGSVLPKSTRKFTFTPSSELPNKQLTATLTAVDQNGTTADKSIQLDREPDSAVTSGDGTAKADTNLLVPILLALAVIAAAITAGAIKLYKQRKLKSPMTPSAQEDIDPQNDKK